MTYIYYYIPFYHIYAHWNWKEPFKDTFLGCPLWISLPALQAMSYAYRRKRRRLGVRPSVAKAGAALHLFAWKLLGCRKDLKGLERFTWYNYMFKSEYIVIYIYIWFQEKIMFQVSSIAALLSCHMDGHVALKLTVRSSIDWPWIWKADKTISFIASYV